ncbi:hypothetical protein IQ227_24930 [Anabaena aphanizomenioides LEGE 00250]|uniref:Uncharacterized protein n=1 Tax=Sphaerospermopsis aphanizomenoides LEGE 00250 TaxID=2777972 RepID=A0ABR9VKX8_9CYAN|nr:MULTISPECIES: hypothetical protein [Nostocales]MBE9239164.1 hypothetical protein [Sphaerospermopsis aphanizomenoides LEGE 00250]
MKLSEQFKLKIQDWGLLYRENEHGFYLYGNLADGMQLYRYFTNEDDADQFMRDGLFFCNDGLWDKYINKPPSSCLNF